MLVSAGTTAGRDAPRTMTNRRDLVAFDPDHFGKRSSEGDPPTPLEAFRHAYRANLWAGAETPSGPGSSADQTAVVARVLPELCRRYGVRTLLDVPCGDLHWMAGVAFPGVQYIGGDLVPEVVAEAALRYGTPDRRFLTLDLTCSALPRADLLLCRDCLVHLCYDDIAKAIDNIRMSEITYLLTTTFVEETEFREIVTGDWRPINLQAPPFSFPAPVELLVEECTEQGGAFADKALGLWRVRDLPDLTAPTTTG
jgi:hypothetical protein